MASLVTIRDPNGGQRFALHGDSLLIGSQDDSGIYLDSLAVSRQHARIICQGGEYFVEDLGSSNGTYVNGHRITGPTSLTEGDILQIGPYVLKLRADSPSLPSSPPLSDQIIRAQTSTVASNQTLFSQNAALELILEISQQLARTLEVEPLLGRLLEHLLRLFPQADRGMVLFVEGDRLNVRAQRSRHKSDLANDYPYSQTIVRRVLEEGVGLLSENLAHDPNLVLSDSMISLNLCSFLCVPLLGWEGRRLGVIQLDCLRPSRAFRADDLEVLTALALHVSTVLENMALHAERLRAERLYQELRLAGDIQQSFLPADFELFPDGDPELFALVHPSREVSGDLYDFFLLPDGRLAFFLGDVSGRGVPAALFMIKVGTLIRNLAPPNKGPADLLRRLNAALAADNPTSLFVTLLHGIYDRRDGSVVIASGGHPSPLLRRANGSVTETSVPMGMLLGSILDLNVSDTRLTLQPGETLILFTDGFTEAIGADRRNMFGLDRLCEVLGGPRTDLPLSACAEEASAAVQRFSGQSELQDDQTLFLLRRKSGLREIVALASAGRATADPSVADWFSILHRVQSIPPSELLLLLDRELAEATQADQPARLVALCVARASSLWRSGDVTGCDGALRAAEQTLTRVVGTEREALTELYTQFKEQRAAATKAGKAKSVRLYEEASARVQVGESPETLPLLEEFLAASVQEHGHQDQATSLLTLGKALLGLEKSEEGLGRLREDLKVAAELGDQDLLTRMRETVAEVMIAAALEEGVQRSLDEVLAEAGRDEKKAEALLVRAIGLARRSATEATALIDQALEFAQQSGAPRLRVAGHQLQGAIAASAGRTTEARRHLATALRLAEEAKLHEQSEQKKRRVQLILKKRKIGLTPEETLEFDTLEEIAKRCLAKLSSLPWEKRPRRTLVVVEKVLSGEQGREVVVSVPGWSEGKEVVVPESNIPEHLRPSLQEGDTLIVSVNIDTKQPEDLKFEEWEQLPSEDSNDGEGATKA